MCVCVCVCVCVVCTGESVEVVVEAEDYLGILEGGYFIRFNAMAVSSDQQLAVMDTALLRFKVLITLLTRCTYMQVPRAVCRCTMTLKKYIDDEHTLFIL